MTIQSTLFQRFQTDILEPLARSHGVLIWDGNSAEIPPPDAIEVYTAEEDEKNQETCVAIPREFGALLRALYEQIPDGVIHAIHAFPHHIEVVFFTGLNDQEGEIISTPPLTFNRNILAGGNQTVLIGSADPNQLLSYSQYSGSTFSPLLAYDPATRIAGLISARLRDLEHMAGDLHAALTLNGADPKTLVLAAPPKATSDIAAVNLMGRLFSTRMRFDLSSEFSFNTKTQIISPRVDVASSAENAARKREVARLNTTPQYVVSPITYNSARPAAVTA